MLKCKDCIIGLEYEPYEGADSVLESYLYKYPSTYFYEGFVKFKYCPDCGNKINWKSISHLIKREKNKEK